MLIISQVENRNITVLKSKVITLRHNADELEKKLMLLLKELNEYNSEVKVMSYVHRLRCTV